MNARDGYVNRRVPDRARGLTSIEKAIAVLEAFDSGRPSLSISELCEELDTPRPTLHRILKQLEVRGFVRQLPSRRYQIGLRLFELGSLVSDQVMLRIPAIPHMHSLYERVEGAVYLSMWDGHEVLHLDCLPSRSEPPLGARAGGRWTAHCSSVGKVLLAHAPAQDLERYLSEPLKPVTRHTITDRVQLLAHLEQVRHQGYATTVEESILGVYGVAAPIRNHHGHVVAAVCIAGRKPSLLERTREVISTAEAISRSIALAATPRLLRP